MKTLKHPSVLVWPTPYQLWFKYIRSTPLADRVSLKRFTEDLQQTGSIELVYFNQPKKENIKCEILDQTKIESLLLHYLARF